MEYHAEDAPKDNQLEEFFGLNPFNRSVAVSTNTLRNAAPRKKPATHLARDIGAKSGGEVPTPPDVEMLPPRRTTPTHDQIRQMVNDRSLRMPRSAEHQERARLSEVSMQTAIANFVYAFFMRLENSIDAAVWRGIQEVGLYDMLADEACNDDEEAEEVPLEELFGPEMSGGGRERLLLEARGQRVDRTKLTKRSTYNKRQPQVQGGGGRIGKRRKVKFLPPDALPPSSDTESGKRRKKKQDVKSMPPPPPIPEVEAFLKREEEREQQQQQQMKIPLPQQQVQRADSDPGPLETSRSMPDIFHELD